MGIDILHLRLDKHVVSTKASYIRGMISPLRDAFGITHFFYKRLYPDKTELLLTTTPKSVETFIEGNFHSIAFSGDVDDYYDCNVIGNYLENCDPILKAEYEHSGLKFHLCMVRKRKKYVEFSFFATTIDNPQIINVYLSHIKTFEFFIDDFKLKANGIILSAYQQRIILPKNANDKTVLVDKVTLGGEPVGIDSILTVREKEVVGYIMSGYSAKEIARIAAVSPRTAEKHIQNIRNKMNCSSQKMLMAKLINDYKMTYSPL